jgi:hypothetical protein
MVYTQTFQVNGVIFTTTVFLDKLAPPCTHVVLTKEKETDVWVTRTETNSKELTDCIKEHRAEAEKFSSEPEYRIEAEEVLTKLGFVKKEKSSRITAEERTKLEKEHKEITARIIGEGIALKMFEPLLDNKKASEEYKKLSKTAERLIQIEEKLGLDTTNSKKILQTIKKRIN